jgi:hypothetical protein
VSFAVEFGDALPDSKESLRRRHERSLVQDLIEKVPSEPVLFCGPSKHSERLESP